MALSERKRRSNNNYLDKCDSILLRPRIERGERIRTAAAASGQSLQQYILEAVEARMEKEGFQIWDPNETIGGNNEPSE